MGADQPIARNNRLAFSERYSVHPNGLMKRKTVCDNSIVHNWPSGLNVKFLMLTVSSNTERHKILSAWDDSQVDRALNMQANTESKRRACLVYC